MKRVLVTGMSGTGESSLPHELAARGHRTVDTAQVAGIVLDHAR